MIFYTVKMLEKKNIHSITDHLQNGQWSMVNRYTQFIYSLRDITHVGVVFKILLLAVEQPQRVRRKRFSFCYDGINDINLAARRERKKNRIIPLTVLHE